MISLASKQDEEAIRNIWKVCFGDTDEYIQLFFSHKFKAENTLVCSADHKIVAALQMVPYQITFYGSILNFYYLAGLSTLPEYRGRGFMGKLIEHSHRIMQERNILLSILVPANENLFEYYKQFGYEQISEKSKQPIYPLKRILDQSTDLKVTYPIFLDTYCKGNLHVQKTLDDYKLIVEEYINSNYEDKFNLGAMAHIINKSALLEHIPKEKYTRNGCETFKMKEAVINFMLE